MSSPAPAKATSLDHSGSSMKTTMLLALLVGGLGLWVLVGEREAKTSAETAFAGKRVLPHLEPSEVTGLEIERKGKPKLELIREGEGEATSWSLSAPLEDRAEPSSVERLLNNLRFAEFAQRLDTDEFASLTLGETELTLSVTRGEKDPYRLTFSSMRPDGQYPVKLEGYTGGFMVRKTFVETNFNDPLWTYRRKELFAIKQSVKLGIDRATGADLTLARHDGFWRLDDSKGEFADPDRCNELVGVVRGLKALAAENDAPSKDELAEYGLSPAILSLSLTPPGEEAKPETVEIGRSVPEQSGVRYARVVGRPFVYQVASAKLDEELEAEREDYRSLKLVPIAGNAQTISGLGAVFSNDGVEWHVERKQDGSWSFREQETRVEDVVRQNLAQRLLDLELLEAVQVTAEVAGVDSPQAQFRVTEAELTREVQVGNPVPEQEGVYYVRRFGEERIYTSELGTGLLKTLHEAELELIEKTILIASHWDAQSLELREGETRLLKTKSVGSDPPTWQLVLPEGARADKDMLTNYMQRFDQIRVDSYVARDLPEVYPEYGLESPLALTIMVRTYVGGEETEEARTLYLGKREGEYVYARNPDGPPAIGKIDAGFLDRAARGFARGVKVLSVDANLVCDVALELEGEAVLELNKPEGAIAWQEGTTLLEEDVEDELKQILLKFESFELTEVSDASPEALKEHGLNPARGKLTLATRPFAGGAPTRYTVLLGEPSGDRVRWAAVEGEGRYGQLFDEVLLDLRKFSAQLPGAFPTPPK